MDTESYRRLLEERKIRYRSFDKVYCPALEVWVFFTSKGFNHLFYNGLGTRRNREDIMRRLKLLHLVPYLIGSAKNTSSHGLLSSGEFWELKGYDASISSEITVILRKISSGKIIFYSVWKSR